MQMTRTIKVLLTTLLAVLLVCAVAVYGFQYAAIYQENGVLENMHVAVLVSGLLLMVVTLIRGQRPDKLVLVFCIFLMYSFALRELDVETLNVPTWVVVIGSGSVRNMIGATVLLALLLVAATNIKYYWQLFKRAFSHPLINFLYLSIGFLLLGDLGERANFIAHNVFIEEACELVGYTALVCALIWLAKKPLDNGCD